MPPLRKLARGLGTALVALVMLAGGALVLWNVFGQGPYGDTCSHSLGCRSYLCMRHELNGDSQVSAPGHCTKSCERDDECGTGTRCVVLGDDARDDLPPFGKPTRACLRVR